LLTAALLTTSGLAWLLTLLARLLLAALLTATLILTALLAGALIFVAHWGLSCGTIPHPENPRAESLFRIRRRGDWALRETNG
jgi:hypothetical protein